MTVAALAIDLTLAGSLLVMAVILLTRDNFLQSSILFIAFGLFTALTWVRLGAPDIALAEAAIGAGVTGVLLMDAIRHMEWEKSTFSRKWLRSRRSGEPPSLWMKIGFSGVTFLIGLLLLGAVGQMGESRPGLAGEAAQRMQDLENPVTAVLLVFRGLDTWLEMGILLLAVLGMLTARERHGLQASLLKPPRDPILEGVVQLLTPLAMLTAAYFLWLGTFSAGGAFQSGVVLGAVGMLLWLSGHSSIHSLRQWMWKMLMMLGFAMFCLAGLITLFISSWMLQFPADHRHYFIVAIEAAAAVSIGACLAGLFVGQHPGWDAFDRSPAGGEEKDNNG
ncbi:hydrogenase subunit MbhD domain-containing protein [Desulfonatronum parangueonense]